VPSSPLSSTPSDKVRKREAGREIDRHVQQAGKSATCVLCPRPSVVKRRGREGRIGGLTRRSDEAARTLYSFIHACFYANTCTTGITQLGIEEIKAKKMLLMVRRKGKREGGREGRPDTRSTIRQLPTSPSISPLSLTFPSLPPFLPQAPSDLQGAVLVSGSLEEEVFTLLNEQRVWNRITAFAADAVSVGGEGREAGRKEE